MNSIVGMFCAVNIKFGVKVTLNGVISWHERCTYFLKLGG
jgi:hypothetical protein